MTAADLLTFLLQAALRGALLGLAALAVAALARRWSAAGRHAVLVAGIVAQPALLLIVVVPRSEGRFPPMESAVRATDAVVASAIRGGPAAATQQAAIPVSPVVLLGMGLGTLLLLFRSWRARQVMAHLRRETLSGDDTRLSDELAEESAAHGIRRPVRIRLGSLPVPVVAGVFRPEIFMPLESLDWPVERRRRALRHELAHIARHDLATLQLALLVRAVWWWNPVVWRLVARLRTTAERAADDAVIRSGQPASDYVDDLVALVREAPVRDRLAPVGFAMARRSEFEGRMMAALDPTLTRGALPRSAIITIGVLLSTVVFALPVSGGSPAAETRTAQPPPDGEAAALLELARTTAPPVERGNLLVQAIRLPLSSAQVDLILTLVGGMEPGIPAGVALRELAGGHALTRPQLVTYLRLAGRLEGDVEKSTSLAALGRRHSLSGEPRVLYLQLAATLPDGPARRTAVDALR